MSAVRETILNNYLSTYVSPKTTRFDSHKRGELRSTYNSIVKMNKEAPWYLPVTNRETQNYAIGLKESARELQNSISELGVAGEAQLFDKKHAYSTNEELASAEYIGDEQDSSSVPSFSMKVYALAERQENTGYYLPDEPVSLSEDTYSFDVNINDTNYEFQFYISEDETSRQIQDRLARLISNAGIGLKASVVENDRGRSALQIHSESSGLPGDRESIFTISDDHTSKKTGAVDYFGLDRVTTTARNASFSINGEMRSAASNHFTVGKMYDVTLNAAGGDDKSLTIGLKTSTESVTANVNQLVGSYNAFLQSVNSFMSAQSRSHQLAGELMGIADYYQDSLSSLGITMAEDGTMSINEEKLKETADSTEDLASTFKSLKEFSGSLMRKSNQVSLNPMEYVRRTVVAYKNPGKNFVSPYTTSAYSGMMYNFLC